MSWCGSRRSALGLTRAERLPEGGSRFWRASSGAVAYKGRMRGDPTSAPVIVVTGASQGIGAAIARAFARRGRCRLALLARSGGKLEEVAREIREGGTAEAAAFCCDVTDPEAVARSAAAVVSELGVPAVLVNNAGEFRAGSFLEYSLEDFDQQIGANLRSAFLISKAFVPAMVTEGRGDIVNICSVASLQAHPGGTGYCAGKAGLLGLTRVMRSELREKGLRVTAVLPGATFTPSWEGAGVPPERMMSADDVAEAVVDLTRLSARTVVEEVLLRPVGGDL